MPPTQRRSSSSRSKASPRAVSDDELDEQQAMSEAEREVREADAAGRRRAGVVDEPDEVPDNVRQIDEGPADYDADAAAASFEAIRPYRLKLGDQWWTVEQPDAGTIMAAEQSPTTEAFMSLMFEEQWPKLRPLVQAHPDPGLLFDTAVGISKHFDLDTAARAQALAQSPMNRAERRAQRPPRRG